MTTQLITPNPDIPCTPGYCLQYVRQTFGLPARYASATEAWENSASQHQDRNFPPGCWIPVWYGLDREPLGHVVLLAPDGSVYSTSDNSTTPHHHPSLTDLEDYYGGWGWPLTYRGWTEDVAGYPVVGGTINVQGDIITPASTIINELQEAGVALELTDLQAIQGFVQTERATVVNEVRANATATVNAVTDALDKAVWAVKTFDQSTDNENGDRIINDFRAQLQSIRDGFNKDAA